MNQMRLRYCLKRGDELLAEAEVEDDKQVSRSWCKYCSRKL